MLSKFNVDKERPMTAVNKKVLCNSSLTLRIRGFYGSSLIPFPRTYARAAIPCCVADRPNFENIREIKHLSRKSKLTLPNQECELGLHVGIVLKPWLQFATWFLPHHVAHVLFWPASDGMLLDLLASSPSSEMSDEIGISHAIYSIHDWFHSDSNSLAICWLFEVEDITIYIYIYILYYITIYIIDKHYRRPWVFVSW